MRSFYPFVTVSCSNVKIKEIQSTKKTNIMLKSIIFRVNITRARNLLRTTRSANGLQYQSHKNHERNSDSSRECSHLFAYASMPGFLSFFRKKEDEENPPEPPFWEKILPEDIALLFKKLPVEDDSTDEGKLVITLKRTILCINRGEYDKAEQMAHLALRVAQNIQSYDGTTLCLDIMANLAFERQQYKKAEQLFEDVLQRLLQKGVPQNDIQILHLSLKVAQLVELQGKKDEAKTNYAWTISKLDEKRKKEPDNKDLKELTGITNSFYGKFLLKNGKFNEAVERLKISHDIFLEVRERNDPDYINIVNDLAVAFLHVNNLDDAEKYINEALRLASPYPEIYESGIYHANKALILLKKGLLDEAQRLCDHADKASRRINDPDGMEQAKYCMEQIKEAFRTKKDEEDKTK
ncbi:tetratricopeptide repeat protein 19 homolog, mitochondrial [Contarinia nasturtii]|uniref:tetratricopeptide repeat protein 19 homolog, mitochondrial n=1 Tax=Contarinia nasturtii TaxID=265458 RepID=UPI0012D39DA5|nr:tetratricopeptide repeat protein 19 homolog, mitochondrial [Contarinia nasturtii]